MSVSLAPTAIVLDNGVTAIWVPIARTTVIADVALWPPTVAVIVAVPGPTAFTTPVELTVATALLDVPHVTARPESTLPFASFAVGVNVTMPRSVESTTPTRSESDVGASVTVATGIGVTVTVAWDETVPDEAVTVAVPTPLARNHA